MPSFSAFGNGSFSIPLSLQFAMIMFMHSLESVAIFSLSLLVHPRNLPTTPRSQLTTCPPCIGVVMIPIL